MAGAELGRSASGSSCSRTGGKPADETWVVVADVIVAVVGAESDDGEADEKRGAGDMAGDEVAGGAGGGETGCCCWLARPAMASVGLPSPATPDPTPDPDPAPPPPPASESRLQSE